MPQQKSTFWIWTTLWLTTLLDSALLFLLFILLIGLLSQTVTQPILLAGLLIVARVISLWLGAYLAVKYVLKKAVVYKIDASKFAALSIIVPLVVSSIMVVMGSSDAVGSYVAVGGLVVTLGTIYYSVRNLIQRLGA